MFCLLGLLPNFFIEAVVNFLQWYELACRTKEFDELKLTTMDDYMRRYMNVHVYFGCIYFYSNESQWVSLYAIF